MIPGVVLLVIGGLLVVAEINTLTFYLLAVAIACFAAGTASIYGATLDYTFGILGLVTFIALAVAHWLRLRLRTPDADHVSQDDAGHLVTVESITPDCLRVVYRGSVWSARLADERAADVHQGDTLRIARREGNVLLLEPPAR
ncbi:MAG TPA: NfeD family protein [Gammaproteobacteria bacterium]|nr:NfeD family protein [Gammaproteobacteria bacterium]